MLFRVLMKTDVVAGEFLDVSGGGATREQAR